MDILLEQKLIYDKLQKDRNFMLKQKRKPKDFLFYCYEEMRIIYE